MEASKILDLVEKHLKEFYRRRIDNLSKLNLQSLLNRRNPYLMRAIGVSRADELAEYLVTAYTLASDETIFGDAFIEPLVIEVTQIYGGHRSASR